MTKKLNGLSLFSSAGIGETYIGEYVEMKVANELLKIEVKYIIFSIQIHK